MQYNLHTVSCFQIVCQNSDSFLESKVWGRPYLSSIALGNSKLAFFTGFTPIFWLKFQQLLSWWHGLHQDVLFGCNLLYFEFFAGPGWKGNKIAQLVEQMFCLRPHKTLLCKTLLLTPWIVHSLLQTQSISQNNLLAILDKEIMVSLVKQGT